MDKTKGAAGLIPPLCTLTDLNNETLPHTEEGQLNFRRLYPETDNIIGGYISH